jgi:hypothetical protein
MRYSVYLYALDGLAFARKLVDESEQILERTRAHLKQEGRVKGRALKYGLKLAADICRGDLPAECSDDYYWALIWMADTELEPITINPLIGFRKIGYIEEVGLWPLLGEWSPPFPAPRGGGLSPAIGYLPKDQIAARALPALAALPIAEEYVRQARRQFVEVLETLDEDGFDLLAVVVS